MSRKDYIAIAAIVKETRDQYPDTVDLYQSALVSKLARYFGDDNEWFNSEKFRQACYGKGKRDGKKVE